MHHRRRFLALLALGFVAALASVSLPLLRKPGSGSGGFLDCSLPAQRMTRLELVFGMGRKGAPDVTDAEWQAFLEGDITPRFPQGLTVLQGYGQWRDARGQIAKEVSRTLIVWFKPTADSEAAIEAIRKAWIERHRQDSVLKAIGSDCVSF
ncbi:MAG: DUF3574 domain-containing protein [Hyphomicrobiaceae bacterium]